MSGFYLRWIEKMLKRQKQEGSSWTSCPAAATSQSFPFFFLSTSASPDRRLPLCWQVYFTFTLLFSVFKGLMPANPMPLCQQRRTSSAQGRHWPETREQAEERPPSLSLLCVRAALGVAGQLFMAPSCQGPCSGSDAPSALFPSSSQSSSYSPRLLISGLLQCLLCGF